MQTPVPGLFRSATPICSATSVKVPSTLLRYSRFLPPSTLATT
jgi:hypothetical protein